MSFWKSLKIGASALSAQRLRLDMISNNVANAETTRTEEGGPYQRKDVVFVARQNTPNFPAILASSSKTSIGDASISGVSVKEIYEDQTQGSIVYDPTHPDADENGNVEYPNVNLVIEMTNMLSATRSYEAALSVIDASKSMALSAIEISK